MFSFFILLFLAPQSSSCRVVSKTWSREKSLFDFLLSGPRRRGLISYLFYFDAALMRIFFSLSVFYFYLRSESVCVCVELFEKLVLSIRGLSLALARTHAGERAAAGGRTDRRAEREAREAGQNKRRVTEKKEEGVLPNRTGGGNAKRRRRGEKQLTKPPCHAQARGKKDP